MMSDAGAVKFDRKTTFLYSFNLYVLYMYVVMSAHNGDRLKEVVDWEISTYQPIRDRCFVLRAFYLFTSLSPSLYQPSSTCFFDSFSRGI